MASEKSVSPIWSEQPLEGLTSTNITYGVVQPGAPTASGVPMVRVNNFSGHSLSLNEVMRIAPEIEGKYERTRLQAGDVLITIVGSVGQVAIVPPELSGWNIARAVALIRPIKSDLSRWIALFLRSPIAQHRLGIAANTTVQTTVNLKDLRAMSVPMPAQKIRNGITELLGSLDDRIDLLRQTNATLEAIAQALFKSWFVDFDPVRAKAAGREPEGMDAATAALFPETLDEWRHSFSEHNVQQLSDARVLAIGDGYRAKNSELGTPGVAFLRAGDLLAGRISPTRDLLSERSLSAAKGKLALAGDTVFTSKGTIGRFAYVPNLNETVVYSPQVCFWRSLDRNVVAPEYLHFWMRSVRFAVQVDRVRGNAAIMDFVSLGDQKAMQIDLPSHPIQRRFAEITGPILERVAVNRAQSDQLASLRDTLLPRLISGKLRIPEAEEQLEEVSA